MLFKEKVYGRSTIMELLATKAALEEENNDVSPSHWNAFKRFLEKVEGIKKVNIVFPDYYEENEIPTEIRSQRPLLLDPVNPYNNLLKGECGYGYGKIISAAENIKEFMIFMSDAARKSLGIIKDGCRDIRMIFRPQPLLFEVIAKEKWLIPKISSYHIGIYSNSDPDIQFPESTSMNTMPEYIIRDPKGQK